MARSVIDCHMAPHRMPHQDRLVAAEVLLQQLEIVVERTDDEFFRIVGSPVTSKVECNHEEALGEVRCQVIPPMCVRAAAVQKNELAFCCVSPGEVVKVGNAIALRRKFYGMGLHGAPEPISGRRVAQAWTLAERRRLFALCLRPTGFLRFVRIRPRDGVPPAFGTSSLAWIRKKVPSSRFSAHYGPFFV